MARMLGNYRHGGCDPHSYFCRRYCRPELNPTRRRKRAEAREVERWLAPQADREWLASLSPLYDLSDCEHGCNGDCIRSGSERCTFVCHGTAGED